MPNTLSKIEPTCLCSPRERTLFGVPAGVIAGLVAEAAGRLCMSEASGALTIAPLVPIVLGAFLALGWLGVLTSVGGAVLGAAVWGDAGSFAVVAGCVVAGLAAAFGIRRLGYRITMDRTRDVLTLVGVTIAGAAPLGALVVASGLAGLGAPGRGWASNLASVWYAIATAILLLGPALFSVCMGPRPLAGPDRRREFLVALCAAIACAAVGLSLWLDSAVRFHVLVVLLLPFAAWAAMRFTPVGASWLIFGWTVAILAVVIAASVTGVGLAGGASAPIWGDLAVVALTGLALSGSQAERSRAAAAVERVQARFRNLVEQSRVIAFEVDLRQQVFTYVNEYAAQLTGYPLERWCSPGFWPEFIHPDDRARVLRECDQLTRAGEDHVLEYRALTADGRTLWIRDFIAVETAGGEARALRGVMIDVTAEKQAEQANLRVQEQYRLLFEESPQPMWVYDRATTRLLEINRAGLALLEYPRERLLEMCLPDMIVEEERDEVRARIGGLSNEARTPPTVSRIRTGSDRIISLETVGFGIPSYAEGARLVAARDVTAQLQAERERFAAIGALRASESRLASIINNTPGVAIEGFDRQGRVVFWNRAAEEIFGWTEDQARGRRLGELILDEAGEADFLAVIESLASGKPAPAPAEWAVTRRDGGTRWVYSTIFVIRAHEAAADMPPDLFICMDVDVTARHEAEQTIRESEHRFRSLADSSPVLIWMSGEDSKSTYYNATWLEFTGNTLEVEMDEGWDRGLHPEDAPMALGRYGACFAERRGFTMEYRFRRHDGEYRWLLDQGQPRFRPDGSFAGFIGSCTDITDLKRAEQALARENRMFSTGPAVVFRWSNSPGRPVEFVSSNVSQFGYSATDFTAGRLAYRDILHPDDADRVASELDAHCRAGLDSFSMEYRIRTGSGEFRWLADYTIIAGRDDAGKVTHLAGYVLDITERRSAEDERRLAQKMEAVGQLARGVAHDFNNLMAAVLISVEQIRRADATREEIRVAAQAIEDVAQQARLTTDSLLSFARGQGGIRRPIELSALIASTVELLQRVLPATIRIETSLPRERGAWLAADPIQVQQILLNLALNARDAMPDGGTLRLRLETIPGLVRLIVSDDGEGMSEEALRHAFEPFFSTKPRGRGTGLGLATVHGIVRAHHAAIRLESAPGKGTTFTIEFPAIAPASLDAGDRGIGIVAVEHPHVRSMISDTLRSAGWRVEEMKLDDSVAAIRSARERWHVAVLDLDNPTPETLESIRSLRQGSPGPTIVVLTRSGVPPIAGVRHVRKPFGVQELLAELDPMRRAAGETDETDGTLP